MDYTEFVVGASSASSGPFRGPAGGGRAASTRSGPDFLGPTGSISRISDCKFHLPAPCCLSKFFIVAAAPSLHIFTFPPQCLSSWRRRVVGRGGRPLFDAGGGRPLCWGRRDGRRGRPLIFFSIFIGQCQCCRRRLKDFSVSKVVGHVMSYVIMCKNCQYV